MQGVTDLPILVLVHGAWHGAWCWAALQADLDGRGLPSLAIDLPGHGASTLPFGDLAGDAAHLADVVSRLDRPVVLVGHSYGGAVIGEAAARPAVRHLVYVAAFCVAEGETLAHQTDVEYPATALAGAITSDGDGLLLIDPSKAAECFYALCPPLAAEAAIARLCPQPRATLTQPATVAAWREIGTTYVLCTRDDVVHPLHQAAMAERCDTVVTLDTDHSPFLSAPDSLADVLEAIVRAS
jgi:pimeloyl-ACP methyl ester carboxylesterase